MVMASCLGHLITLPSVLRAPRFIVGRLEDLPPDGFLHPAPGREVLGMEISNRIVVDLRSVRALIPRLWCTFYFGRSFVPEDPYIATMVWHGFCLTWFIGFAWLAILNNARMAYSECVIQMKLTSALVHLEKRHAYLKSLLDEGTVTEDEFRTLSRKLPYISMDVVDNIKAWWLLREYAIIDTMDERVTLEITMVLVFGLIFLTVAKCMYDFLT